MSLKQLKCLVEQVRDVIVNIGMIIFGMAKPVS